MNSKYRKQLAGTQLDYFDTQAAVDDIQPGAYAKLPYTSKVLAENLVRRCDPETLTDCLKQIIERKRDLRQRQKERRQVLAQRNHNAFRPGETPSRC